MAYGHAQLLLYRPFLHYVSQSSKTKTVDQRAFACASACISVSRNIIHITAEMKKRGLLTGAYWFSMYTTFFAIISILYYVLENPDSPTSHELFKDAMEGKEVLAHFAKRSMAADRCTATLNVSIVGVSSIFASTNHKLQTIFDRLPDAVKQGGDSIATKKRRQGSSPQSLQSRPSMLKADSDFIAMGIRRASTFPESMPNSRGTALGGHPLPISQAHLANLGFDPAYSSPSQASSDYMDPIPSLTPTSTGTSSHGGFGIGATHTPPQRPAQPFPPTPMTSAFVDPIGLNAPLSDVSAMMFPSTDPFAYPNQPMTTFENNNPQNFAHKTEASPTMASLPFQTSGIDMKSHPSAYSPSGLSNVQMGPRRPDDNNVQLFGPMPMYLMQGAQLAAAQGQREFRQPQNSHLSQVPGSDNMNFEDIFGGEEWANTFMDQGLGLSGSGTGFGGQYGFGHGAPPPGAGNWGR
jgi:hypothetical protein